MMKNCLLFTMLLLPLVVASQTKITTYHDRIKGLKNEEYFVLNADSSQIDGKYVKYNPEGVVIIEGDYVKG
ncbi:MAG: toxin-antitoxin system YwqK family antitoxin, partial [Imperialibacter sp.]